MGLRISRRHRSWRTTRLEARCHEAGPWAARRDDGVRDNMEPDLPGARGDIRGEIRDDTRMRREVAARNVRRGLSGPTPCRRALTAAGVRSCASEMRAEERPRGTSTCAVCCRGKFEPSGRLALRVGTGCGFESHNALTHAQRLHARARVGEVALTCHVATKSLSRELTAAPLPPPASRSLPCKLSRISRAPLGVGPTSREQSAAPPRLVMPAGQQARGQGDRLGAGADR